MLTFLAALLAFGTIWFWLFSFVVFCAITALVENDEGVWATIVFVGTVLSLNFLSKIPILSYVTANPGHTLMYVGIYFAVGIVWTLIKWYFFVHNKSVLYKNYRAKFLKARKTDELTPALAAELQESVRSDFDLRNADVTGAAPDPIDHKSDLTRWGTYWPFSMVGTALNDIIRKAWDYVYEMLQSTYKAMSLGIFKTGEADTRMAEEYRAKRAVADDSSKSSRRSY